MTTLTKEPKKKIDKCWNCGKHPIFCKDYREDDMGNMNKILVCKYCVNLNDKWFYIVNRDKLNPKTVLERQMKTIITLLVGIVCLAGCASIEEQKVIATTSNHWTEVDEKPTFLKQTPRGQVVYVNKMKKDIQNEQNK